MSLGLFESILFATIVAGTPLMLVALGELVTEKSGMLNLGAEGLMSIGAVAAFAASYTFESTVLGILAAMVAAMLLSMVFAFITINLMANQVATGLAVAIFGVGLSAFLGKPFEAKVLQAVPGYALPLLSEIPLLGPALFKQQWLVYVSWITLAAVAWFLGKTRAGLALKAVGESPQSAHAVGLPVIRIRYLAVMFGGAMAGLGGAFISLFHTPMWNEGMIAGKGWIALALVVFSTWRPWRVMLGAYLFGGVMISQLFFQSSSVQVEIPSQFLSALPYLATIVVLVLISSNAKMIRLNSPASLGKPFLKENS